MFGYSHVALNQVYQKQRTLQYLQQYFKSKWTEYWSTTCSFESFCSLANSRKQILGISVNSSWLVECLRIFVPVRKYAISKTLFIIIHTALLIFYQMPDYKIHYVIHYPFANGDVKAFLFGVNY